VCETEGLERDEEIQRTRGSQSAQLVAMRPKPMCGRCDGSALPLSVAPPIFVASDTSGNVVRMRALTIGASTDRLPAHEGLWNVPISRLAKAWLALPSEYPAVGVRVDYGLNNPQ
jgi:hypothetical protein